MNIQNHQKKTVGVFRCMSLMWIHTSQYSHSNNVRARWKAILTLACDEMILLKKLNFHIICRIIKLKYKRTQYMTWAFWTRKLTTQQLQSYITRTLHRDLRYHYLIFTLTTYLFSARNLLFAFSLFFLRLFLEKIESLHGLCAAAGAGTNSPICWEAGLVASWNLIFPVVVLRLMVKFLAYSHKNTLKWSLLKLLAEVHKKTLKWSLLQEDDQTQIVYHPTRLLDHLASLSEAVKFCWLCSLSEAVNLLNLASSSWLRFQNSLAPLYY